MKYGVYRVDGENNSVVVKTFNEKDRVLAYTYAADMNKTTTEYTYVVRKIN